MLRALVSAFAVVGLLTLAAAFTYNSGRAAPALTRSNSVLPTPLTPVLCSPGPSRPPLHPLEL